MKNPKHNCKQEKVALKESRKKVFFCIHCEWGSCTRKRGSDHQLVMVPMATA